MVQMVCGWSMSAIGFPITVIFGNPYKKEQVAACVY